MRVQGPDGALFIAATFFLAVFLAVLPLPEWAAPWRPSWVMMVLVYWSMVLPERVGVGSGWLIGLLLDALHGTPLGQNAAVLAIAAYVTAKNYRRLQLFPVVQQALWMGLILSVNALLTWWVRGIRGLDTEPGYYWLSVLSSMAIWPWVYLVLGEARQRYAAS
jgi:rod shape-determining protein MreD